MPIRLDIIPDMEIRTSLGYNDITSIEFNQVPLVMQRPEYRTFYPREANHCNTTNRYWSIEPMLNYKKQISNGNLNVLLGSAFQQNDQESNFIFGTGYSSDDMMRSINMAPTVTASSFGFKYKYNAVFGRINYIHSDRYMVSFTGRRDGSSKFGPQNRFNNLGSVGAAWIFSEERGFKRIFFCNKLW